MKFNKLLLTLMLGMTALTIGCADDNDTPADKKRSSYLSQPMRAAREQNVDCNGTRVLLPVSKQNQTLESYLVELHLRNREQALSRLSVAKLQDLYRDCIRPAILERL